MQPSTNISKQLQQQYKKKNTQIISTDDNIPLKKSTKDWTIKKETTLHDLPLISRSSNDDKRSNTPNLKNVKLQKELWNDICKEILKVTHHTDTKYWTPLVISFRKLREGIRASNWSEGNIRFAIKVYEESVHTSLRGRDFAEFRKAIRGLVDELYLMHKKGINGHYLALDALYQACHLNQYQLAIHQLIQIKHQEQKQLYYNQYEINYTIQLLQALNHHDCISFFKLYHQSPHPAFHVLLEPSIITLRQYVLKTMQKAYYMASLTWVSTCLGFPSSYEEKDIIQLIEQLYEICIDKIENNTIYFKKIKK